MDHTATYSPDDNKLRLYPDYRLPRDEYDKLKSAGFKWAAKQELFVAPMWTPKREDLLLEMCGEITDDDSDIVTRAEERAERFDGYSERRLRDANRARDAVSAISDNIPLGQPILVGHHSERHARRDAKRIENGMRKAIKMWETSKYWEHRANACVQAAKYKERPDVRARRIKKIEADRRKQERTIKDARKWLNVWLSPSILTMERAKFVANYSMSFDMWSKLDKGEMSAKEARNHHVPVLERTVAIAKRWINHYDNRLVYEKAMLADQGASELLEKPKKQKQLPLCNYREPAGIDTENIYHRSEMIHYPQVKMTKAEYKRISNDYKGTRVVDNSHRVRIAMTRHDGKLCNVSVFITDSKEHRRPAPVDKKEPKVFPMPRINNYRPPERTEFDDMKDALKNGVNVVSAPQLFPTPPDIAEKMVALAEIEKGDAVLEPSAGTGNIMQAIMNDNRAGAVVAIEINQGLADSLKKKYPLSFIHCLDFLTYERGMGSLFDRIIMNPPFKNGEDIKHIEHALTMLKLGGKLVALCANGPRQREKLTPLADSWEDLPEGSFKESGTMVNVAMLTICK